MCQLAFIIRAYTIWCRNSNRAGIKAFLYFCACVENTITGQRPAKFRSLSNLTCDQAKDQVAKSICS